MCFGYIYDKSIVVQKVAVYFYYNGYKLREFWGEKEKEPSVENSTCTYSNFGFSFWNISGNSVWLMMTFLNVTQLAGDMVW